ncbi:hypothetical protein IJ732_05270, partial [bacterium]|nr:hypothetical protein [bacterium]
SDCIQDVCLTDGSSYSYECDETKCTGIIIDTNGDKKPNSAGKDRYRMLVTNKGLIAQGESEYCGTIDGGLDCGKYILTYHKLFDGLINNCTAYDNGQCSQCENGYQNNGNSCKDIRENTCATYSGTTCTKCTTDNLLADGECIAASSLNCQITDGVNCTTCMTGTLFSTKGSCVEGTVLNGINVYKVDNYYVADAIPMSDYTNFSDDTYVVSWGATVTDNYTRALKYCQSKGMTIPSAETFRNLDGKINSDDLGIGGCVWTSDQNANNSDQNDSYCTGSKSIGLAGNYGNLRSNDIPVICVKQIN